MHRIDLPGIHCEIPPVRLALDNRTTGPGGISMYSGCGDISTISGRYGPDASFNPEWQVPYTGPRRFSQQKTV